METGILVRWDFIIAVLMEMTKKMMIWMILMKMIAMTMIVMTMIVMTMI